MISGTALRSGTDEAREARCRRAAKRLGLAVVKSRYTATLGTYGIIDPYTNAWVSYGGGDGYGLSLEEIERELTEDDIDVSAG